MDWSSYQSSSLSEIIAHLGLAQMFSMLGKAYCYVSFTGKVLKKTANFHFIETLKISENEVWALLESAPIDDLSTEFTKLCSFSQYALTGTWTPLNSIFLPGTCTAFLALALMVLRLQSALPSACLEKSDANSLCIHTDMRNLSSTYLCPSIAINSGK